MGINRLGKTTENKHNINIIQYYLLSNVSIQPPIQPPGLGVWLIIVHNVLYTRGGHYHLQPRRMFIAS